MAFDKIGFIGFGLIGGSIAKRTKQNNPNIKIIATAGRESTVTTAHSMGLIDNDKKLDIKDFADCDYIFLCAPVQKNIEYLAELKSIIKPGCIITDVGSTKTEIHEEVKKLDMEANFIGGHPMAGSEKTGIENADDHMLENAYYIITPTTKTTDETLQEFEAFVRSLKSIPLILDCREHDRATASISHLPHMISFALTNLVKRIDDDHETMKTIAAGGFRDMTRIASSSPVMWQNICFSNKEQLLLLMDLYTDELAELRKHVEAEDEQDLLDYFQSAKDYRDSLFIPSKKSRTTVYEFYVDIVDEAGGIAVIASMLAFKGINIKNIGIINNREFVGGVLRIEFNDEADEEKAAALLESRNYIIYRR